MKNPGVALLALLAVVAMVLAACGGGSSDPTSAATTAGPTATTAATPTTAAPTTTTAAPTTTQATNGGTTGTEFTVTANNNAFDTDRITIKAGEEVTVTFKNQDSTTDEEHNIRFKVGTFGFATPLELAPSTDVVTFTVDEPGEYEFFCDTHLEEMQGTLVVVS